MDYGEIFSKAWKIIWKHKILWVFGILASCGSRGGGGGGGGNYNFNNNDFSNGNIPAPFRNLPDWFNHPENFTGLIILIVVTLCIISIIALVLGVVGRAGLIRGAYHADRDENVVLSFGSLFSEGLRYFWRIFLLDLVVGLAFMVIVLAVAAVGFGVAAAAGISVSQLSDSASSAAAGGAVFSVVMLFLFCLCCIFVPISIVVGLLLELAYPAIAIDELGVFGSLGRAWELAKSNLGTIVLLGIVLGIVINGVVGALIGLPMILVMLPAIIAMMGGQDAMQAGIAVSLLCCAIYLPVLLVLRGILNAYTQSAWSLAYLRMTAGSREPQGELPTGVEVFPA